MGDHKKCWQDVKEVIPDSDSDAKIALCDKHSEKDLPNYINNYFINVSKNLAEKLTGDWIPKSQPLNSNFLFREITLEELL